MNASRDIIRKAAELLDQRVPVLDPKELREYIRFFLNQAERFLILHRKQGSPVYVFDRQALLKRAHQFRAAFDKYLSDFHIFYAVKSNNHPLLAESLVDFGLGLDVSSGMELELALGCGCRDILFSGPGKTEGELHLAAAHHNKITVLMDSFGELERLEQVARHRQRRIRAGIRLTSDERGLWRKFGIPLSALNRFMDQAEACPHVNLCGLQFHTSWNRDPKPQTAFIRRIGQSLSKLAEKRRTSIRFLDIGGGYWPPVGEWLQADGTPAGRLQQLIRPEVQPSTAHYKIDAQPIEAFARQISAALTEHIFPQISCRVCAEPGRWLSNDAMHIVLTVIDKKADDLVITDAGTNIIGWERFESDFAPVINLSRPSQSEHACLVLGSLCTPHDVWGYSYFGDGIEAGDVLLIPSQGAYTYSLRQEFIKPLAKVVAL